MLQNILYALPELALLTGVIHLWLCYLLGEESSKLFARIARIWLIGSMLCLIIFYNQSLNPHYYANNAYTFLFRTMAYVFTYIILWVAPQYFSAEKRIGCKFYILLLLALSVADIMLAAINIWVLISSYCLLALINYRLLDTQSDQLPEPVKSRYIVTFSIILILLAAGGTGLYNISGGNMAYKSVAAVLVTMPDSFAGYICVAFLIVPFLYSLGIAPFHSFAEDKTGRAVLPVSHYLAVVAPWVYWGTFIKLNNTIVKPYAEDISQVYTAFALFSVIIGAMGANARINLHRIYSFCATYYFGIVLLLLSLFNPAAEYAAYVCLWTYLLSIGAVYLVFYSLKSRNEYLAAITSLSGLAETRPFATTTLLISLFSLIGMPPLAGFLGQADIVSSLIAAQKYISLGCVFFCLLLLARAFLEIMKTAYFEHKIIVYDVESKAVRLIMLLNMACLAAAAFNPFGVIDKMKDMFYALFL